MLENVIIRTIDLEKLLPQRKPKWLTVRLPAGEGYSRLKNLMRSQGLHTVCEEAMCPNMGECWHRGIATFLLMGDICTRSYGFCHIKTARPQSLDEDEPRRVAESVAAMNLNHWVLTSVNRDELPNGDAHIFANTIREIRQRLPGCTIEVLIPDFKGDRTALQQVMDARQVTLDHHIRFATVTAPAGMTRFAPSFFTGDGLGGLPLRAAAGGTDEFAGVLAGFCASFSFLLSWAFNCSFSLYSCKTIFISSALESPLNSFAVIFLL
jgi:lipoate synthase